MNSFHDSVKAKMPAEIRPGTASGSADRSERPLLAIPGNFPLPHERPPGCNFGPRCSYFVVERDGQVMGGGGVAPLENAAADVCELRKMYFLPQARGIGAGTAMMRRCLDAARAHGFKRCYLETLTGMDAAQALYRRSGFTALCAPMGGTGHFSCDRFFILDL